MLKFTKTLSQPLSSVLIFALILQLSCIAYKAELIHLQAAEYSHGSFSIEYPVKVELLDGTIIEYKAGFTAVDDTIRTAGMIIHQIMGRYAPIENVALANVNKVEKIDEPADILHMVRLALGIALIVGIFHTLYWFFHGLGEGMASMGA